MNKEIFVDSPIFPDKYLVSNHGRVKTKETGLIRKLSSNKDGYPYVRLWRNGKAKYMTVHRLVALAFVPNEEKDRNQVINHIDGVKTNNYFENLEWCDVQYNTRHSYELGLQKPVKGSKHGRSKYDEDQIHEVCRFLQDTSAPINEVATQTDVSVRTVQSVRARQNWTFISDMYTFHDRRSKGTCND